MNLTEKQQQIVKDILNKCVPGARVGLFGSRAKGTTKEFSDLDLVIRSVTKQPLSLKQLSDLKEAFSESDLPFRVDIIDFHQSSKEFLGFIHADEILIQD